MNGIEISINPTYFCNFRCDFCYLSSDQLGDSTKIPLEKLNKLLSEASLQRTIEGIDIYGGEVGLLRSDYWKSMKQIIRDYYKGPLSVITNFSVMSDFLFEEDIVLSVSWDYRFRERHEEVYLNILNSPVDLHMLVLANEDMVKMTDEELDVFIGHLNAAKRVRSVEIKPYSLNRHHQQSVSYAMFESFVKRWILRMNKFSFEFVNYNKIKKSLRKEYHSWSDGHIYITPKGEWAVLEFDKGVEFFKALSSIAEYENWALKEKILVNSNQYCQSCDYLGHCLSEHLQDVESLDNSCNGFRNLLRWCENERL